MTRSLKAWPITCPVCQAEPGNGCRNVWGGRVHYQHDARKRLRDTQPKAEAPKPAKARPIQPGDPS